MYKYWQKGMGDTGLLVSLAFAENEITEQKVYKNIMDGKLSLNKGMLYENVIAQMIVHPKNLVEVEGVLRIPAYMFALCDI